MMCLRKIVGVSHLYKVRNKKIRQSLGLNYTVTHRITQKGYFFGLVKRMSQKKIPQTPSGLQTGRQETKCRHAKKWMDCIKQNIKIGGMTAVTEAGRMFLRREAWNNIIKAEWRRCTHADALGQGVGHSGSNISYNTYFTTSNLDKIRFRTGCHSRCKFDIDYNK